jgi:hypothetical protein
MLLVTTTVTCTNCGAERWAHSRHLRGHACPLAARHA